MSVSPLDRFKSVLINAGSDEFKVLEQLRQQPYIDEKRISNRDIEAYKDIIDSGEYKLHRQLKTVVIYRKMKPHDRLFEDRVWLLMRRMGATVLNRPNSTLLLNDTGRTKQIDVIARLETNIVFVIECKSAAEPESRSLRKDLAETKEYKKEVIGLCRGLWGDGVRVAFIYALNNIKLSKTDELDSELYEIRVWDTFSLSYFDDLVDRLSDAAKYQIFAEVFEEQEISGYSPRVPAIKATSGNNVYYYFLARPSDLLKIAYIHHRKLKRLGQYENPYQRMVDKKRVEDIRQFIKRGGSFPNDIILNFRRTPTFQELSTVEGIRHGILTLPPYYKSAWIVDGQHRLFGYTNTVEASNEFLPVFAYESLSEEKQGELFVDINRNQKSVEPNLLWDLYSDMYFESTEEGRRLFCTISMIGKELNTNKNSPLYGHIYIPSMNDKTPSTNITLQTICNRLLKGTFIRRKGGRGDLFKDDWGTTVDFAAKRLIQFFDIIRKANENDWNRGEEGFTRSNVGVNSFMLVLQEIIKEFRKHDKNPVLSDDSFDKEIRHLTAPLVKALVALDQKQATAYRQSVGEKGFAENARRFCKVIHDEITSFSPDILREEIEVDENPEGIPNPSQAIDQVELKIRELIHVSLLNKFGPKYWDHNNVIPQDVRDTVTEKIEDELTKHPYRTPEDYKPGEKRIQFCEIMDYSKMIISKNNWEVFEKVFRSKETVEDKFKKLNEYRRMIKHTRSDEQIDDIVRREGEAAIIWFSRILGVEP